MQMEQREAEFRQRILAASQGPNDPMLYWKMFNPEHIPAEPVDDSGILFPTDEEGFEAMIQAWEEADKAEENPRPFAETLGFRTEE